MHVLHEDALSRIAAVAESVVVLDQKMERGFAEVRKTIREEVDYPITTGTILGVAPFSASQN
jgi:hypothetical protein